MRILIILILFISITSPAKVDENVLSFDGKIAGNKSIQECITGGLTSDSAMSINTLRKIEITGYPAEVHVVLTEDGYLLTLHRIPGGVNSTPVFLQHGLLSSSFDWVIADREKGLAFILHDQGYDVWMGNSRGNTYSRCSVKFSPSQFEFWDFSWHEMGIYDLPAVINYVTNHTKKDPIYVGHSMGTTMFYVFASEKPDVASKVKAMFSFSPVVYFNDAKSWVFLITPLSPIAEFYQKIVGGMEILPNSKFSKEISKYVCTEFTWQRHLCYAFMGLVYGPDPQQFNYTLLPSYLYHTPAGSSLKTVLHYAQVRNSGKFKAYDYGSVENFDIYRSTEPPEYNISNIQVPIGLFWSENDYFTSPAAVKRFSKELPNEILNYKVKWPKFNHNDYIFARDVVELVYSELLSAMKDFQ